MERVSFITTDADEKDLIVSFAIQEEEGAGGVKSLTLLRTPEYERFLHSWERGVGVSHEAFPEEEDRRELLEVVELGPEDCRIVTDRRTYTLDLLKVDPIEIQAAKEVFRAMDFDDRFELRIE